MKTHERFIDGTRPRTGAEILAHGGRAAPLWASLQEYLRDAYGCAPELVFYGEKHGWTARYRKGGRALCSLIPECGSFTALVVLGRVEAAAALARKHELSSRVRRMLTEAKPLHDGRWLWIRPESPADVESIKTLLGAKRKPAPATAVAR
jgi:hypothetical protein